MHTSAVTRRQFGAAALATVSAALAGCLNNNGDDENLDTGGTPVHLVVSLENDDGEPVSEGVSVTISHDEQSFTSNFQHEIDGGRLVARTLADPGAYTVTVESLADEFDVVEREVSLDEANDEDDAEDNATEITIELPGATGDGEREEDG
ncbi:S-layer protein [Halobacteria archaeon AArc-dxtr1]|nr:S-layer protein [Halobacteria archaeon AArc-dxtr1]